jgi:sortase A
MSTDVVTTPSSGAGDGAAGREFVIDLRTDGSPVVGTAPASPDTVTPDPPNLPGAAPARPRSPITRHAVERVVGRVVIGLLAVVLVFGGYELFVTDLVYGHRQDHIGAGFTGSPRSQFVPGRGDAVAVLQIPSIGLDVFVVEGDGSGELRGGPGHRMGTPVPGEVGNSVIRGHRDRFGGPFEHLDDLAEGAEVFAQSKGQPAVRYRVVSVERVDEAESDLLGPTDDERLTLVTSAGGRFSDDHLVVVAERDSERGTPIVRGGEAAASGSETTDDATATDGEAAGDGTATDVDADGSDGVDLALEAGRVGSVGQWVWPLAWSVALLFAVAVAAEARRRFPWGAVVAVATGPVLLLALLVAFSVDGVLPSTL